MTLQEALLDIAGQPETAWVYLPADKNWDLNSMCAILESEEVPPELEDELDAGVPAFAKANDLIQALPVTVVQDVTQNALAQRPGASPTDLLEAFLFYYEHDAFIDLTR